MLSLLVYLPMLVGGFWVKSPGSFLLGGVPEAAGGIFAALVLGALTVAANRWVSRHTGWGRSLLREFAALFGGVDSRAILVLALLSAFGEEVLFRGVLQPRIGLFPTALLFGTLHFPLRPVLWPWTLYAMIAGLVLGVLTEFAETLWPAILLHFIINHFSLHDIAEATSETNSPDRSDSEKGASGDG